MHEIARRLEMHRFLRPDARHAGVRPINILLLRTLYLLMALFVATDAWRTILAHQGPWDPVRAVAVCVWATYPTLAILGVVHPLRMLPIMLFAIGYKTLWLAAVAWPMWHAGTLAGSSAAPMTRAFLWTPLAIAAVPWSYVFRHYVLPTRRAATLPAGGNA